MLKKIIIIKKLKKKIPIGDLSQRFKKRWDRSFSIREWRDLSQRFQKRWDRSLHSLMKKGLSQRFCKRWDRLTLFQRFEKRWDRFFSIGEWRDLFQRF